MIFTSLSVISIFVRFLLSYLMLVVGYHRNVTITDVDYLIMLWDLSLKHLGGSLCESFERIKLLGKNRDL